MRSFEGHTEKIQGVAFDAFGTLVRIGDRKQPFLRLMKLARQMGRRPDPNDSRVLMTEELGLNAAALYFGIAATHAQLAELERDLFSELESVQLYPDSLPAIRMLQDAGVRVAICSNLAAPYAIPVKLLLPDLSAYTWSFTAGALKPEQEIYERVAQQLNFPLSNLAMIGDTLEADCLGPRRYGMQGFYLDRSGKADASTFSELTEFAQFVLSSHR